MPNFPGTSIPLATTTNDRVNALIDNSLTPRMLLFRQVCVYDEQLHLLEDGITWRATFGNWLPDFQLEVRKNGKVAVEGAGPFGYGFIDDLAGTLETGVVDVGADGKPFDVVTLTYQFNYFPGDVLQNFIIFAVDHINAAAYGPPTDFTIDSAPNNWDAVISDIAFALSMERLILDYDLWKGRIIFAIGPTTMEGDSGDIISQLEMLKQNAESRANKALENEKFKVGNALSPPTPVYFDAVRGIGGAGSRAGGFPPVGGRLRGWRPTKYI